MNTSIIGALALASLLTSQEQLRPARFKSGSLPAQPARVTGGGQVLLEVKVDNQGKVSNAITLRDTPPFTDLLREAVRLWRFDPAQEDYEDVESSVLVAALFRPPTLMGAPTVGEPPQNVGPASDAVPVPHDIVPPAFPPGALAEGVGLVEVLIARDGTVKEVHIMRSAPGFDDVATAAALKWKFRPARRGGRPVRSFAYIVFGFRPPITPQAPKLD